MVLAYMSNSSAPNVLFPAKAKFKKICVADRSTKLTERRSKAAWDELATGCPTNFLEI